MNINLWYPVLAFIIVVSLVFINRRAISQDAVATLQHNVNLVKKAKLHCPPEDFLDEDGPVRQLETLTEGLMRRVIGNPSPQGWKRMRRELAENQWLVVTVSHMILGYQDARDFLKYFPSLRESWKTDRDRAENTYDVPLADGLFNEIAGFHTRGQKLTKSELTHLAFLIPQLEYHLKSSKRKPNSSSCYPAPTGTTEWDAGQISSY